MKKNEIQLVELNEENWYECCQLNGEVTGCKENRSWLSSREQKCTPIV